MSEEKEYPEKNRNKDENKNDNKISSGRREPSAV